MTLNELRNFVLNKSNFSSISNFADFASYFLEFIVNGLQADIVSRNETSYHFYQYAKDGNYTISMPINIKLMFSINNFENAKR